MKSLMIVESPKKAKTIQNYLANTGILVRASVGHIRDLPKNEMGVKPPLYKPEYVFTDKGKLVISDLKKIIKEVDMVYLAADPDREGEAIAWHLQDVLKLKNYKRIEYREITKEAIENALKNPRDLNYKLIASQEARRILDRLVGFRVSNFVRNGTGENLPVGRVQSPACKLVVIRENQIRSFKTTEHYSIKLNFGSWNANLDLNSIFSKYSINSEYLTDIELTKNILNQIDSLKVIECIQEEKYVKPPAPFKTSQFQQSCFNKFSFSSDETMKIAQSLYEKGMITYHRTDSVNVSDKAFFSIGEYALKNKIPVVKEKRTWKEKDNSQQAHEAIRPTDLNADVSSLNDDELKVYNLIFSRFLASQLEDSLDLVKKIKLESNGFLFNAVGSVNLKKGWKVVYSDESESESESENSIFPESIEVGSIFFKNNFDAKIENKKTKAPTRYNQATLISALESIGIGRPSTYASIMNRIISHGYVEEKSNGKSSKKYLYATEKSFRLFDCLNGNFNFFDMDYTKNLEMLLDDIAEGKAVFREVLTQLDNDITKSIESTKLSCKYNFDCTCGKGKLKRYLNKTSNKHWWGCSEYPNCRNTFFDESEKPNFSSNVKNQ